MSIHFGGLDDHPSKSTVPPQPEAPTGYILPEVFSTTSVRPGEDLLFSVPVNHVGPSWDLQIRFYLDLPGGHYGTGPYSAVSFGWQDIPEKYRDNTKP